MTTAKKFGFWTLTFLVVANMIGAGVFTTSGHTIKDLGSPHVVLAAWAVGGLIAIAGAAGYGQLTRLMPQSGGEYLFLSRAAHPFFGFVAGWVSLIAGFSGPIAYAASALESYLLADAERYVWLPAGSIAVAVIIVAGLFHGWRPRVGWVSQNGVVVLKLGVLAIFLALAAVAWPSHQWHVEGLAGVPTTGWAAIGAFASSLVWISLSYSGFNAAVYIAGEADDARRDVPRSLVCGTGLVVVLYLLLNAVFVYAAPADAIAGKDDVAAVAAEALGGVRFATFVRVCVCLALLTSVMSMMLAAPRVYAKMADDGFLPRWLKFRGDAPAAAVGVQVAVAILLTFFYQTLAGLLNYLSLTLSLSAACSVTCLFLPKVRRRPIWHPAHLLPLFYVVSTLMLAAILTATNPRQVTGTALTFLAGAIAYVCIGRGNRPTPT